MGHRSGSPSSLCSHSGVCSGRSSLLQVAGGALASRCTSELHLCALRDPTSAGVPPEGDYLEGDLACSALCSSRPHFSCGVGLECSSRDRKTICTARLPSLFLSLERTAFDWGCFSSFPLVFPQL